MTRSERLVATLRANGEVITVVLAWIAIVSAVSAVVGSYLGGAG